jgi:pantothenate kinase
MSERDGPITQAELIERLVDLPRDKRRLVAVAGPPGAGKSTLAEALVAALNLEDPGRAAVLPMDGYHYDDAILEGRGLRARKGAPETFDVAGFLHMLRRLRTNEEEEIAVPVFDRGLEIARNAARIIPRSVDLLVVEGNYLLLDRDGWRDLAPLFDLTVAIRVPLEELRRRLTDRWRSHGIAEPDIPAKVEANDLPNGIAVLNESIAADLVFSD